jgi:DNA-binding NarL/FixJ family response regulator
MTRIVVADDHAMFREGLVQLLKNANLEVVAECSNGREALSAVMQHQPDIALIDVTMPELDGISLAARVSGGGQAPRVIILTMHDAPDVCSRALAAGAVGYILKDDAFQELATAIRQALNGKTYISTSVRTELTHFEQGFTALTAREEKILRLITQGKSNRVIAEELGISSKTVDVHRTNLMRKLNLHTTADLVRHAMKTGLL